jgi:hypothetical protein
LHYLEWAKEFPLKDLRKRGHVESKRIGEETVWELLDFFGVGDVDAWERVYGGVVAQYRQSTAYSVSRKAQATYVRLCELTAEVWDMPPYEEKKLQAAVEEVRSRLTEKPESLLSEAKGLLRDAGVALVVEREVEKSRLSGAAFWPRRNKAILALTGRFKTADHLWFSFFHEAGHLLLHRDRMVLETEGNSGDLENEADAFAREVLLPPAEYETLAAKGAPALEDIKQVSDKHGLPVDSLIGMLQHDGVLPFSRHSELKRSVSIGKDESSTSGEGAM